MIAKEFQEKIDEYIRKVQLNNEDIFACDVVNLEETVLIATTNQVINEFEIFLKSLGFKDLNEYLRLENIKKADIWENYETCEGCGKVFYNSNDNTVQKGISYNWNGDFYCIDCQDWETVIQDYMNTGEIIVQMCDYLREELERQGFKYKENTVIFTMEKEILDKYINKDIEDYLKIYSTRPNSIELWSRTKEN